LRRLFQVVRVQREGVVHPRRKHEAKRFLGERLHLELGCKRRMRILVRRHGVILPFLEVAKAIAVRVLGENARVRDGELEVLQPLVGHRRMHLGGLQRRRQAVRGDEVFFGNEKTGASAESPLCRLPEFLHGVLDFESSWRGHGGLR
jgi:hypothetical protein